MTKNFSRKTLIEWTLEIPTSVQCTVFSKVFSLQDQRCMFEFYSGFDIHNNAYLFFKSDEEMDPPITITVRAVSNRSNFGSKIESVARDKIEIIWLHTSRLLQGLTLTFEVSFDDDSSKGKLFPNTLLTCVFFVLF